jgi:uncharacterized oxidoreductase
VARVREAAPGNPPSDDLGWAKSSAEAGGRLVDRARLEEIVRRLFLKLGSEPREADLIAVQLVTANLLGHDSHGVSLVPLYVRMVREGKVRLNAHASMTLDSGAVATLDGHRGFGQVVALEAVELGIARARQHGLAAIALRNSHHVGRIGHWAELCAEAGLVSIHLVNVLGLPPVVAPFAGRDARLHTNPFAIGLPREGRPPLVLDFATSRAAQGKMRIAMNKGVAAPPGYLLDADGRPSTDPAVVYASPLGALLPFGDHKGAGLGLMCDLLAGALSGAGTLHEGAMEDGVCINNMLSLILDPDRLGGRATWAAEIEAGLAFVKASPERVPGAPVLAPGESERLVQAERLRDGIPIDAETWRQLCEAAGAAGVPV